ncbi:IS982 family transposase, partial [Prevotella sp. OH937_COT-195]|uniref:IS982 family transposase n=1 Tax=Prevotella sp. OH937_COT-195 TaxID=2491051 RepID=UPI000F653050
DSTMIPVCHNVRRYFNKVFKGIAKSGKGTMGWCHGFKSHLLCNDTGDIITFCLTPANVDDGDKRVWSVFTKVPYGKVFADRGYIKRELFESLFDRGIHLVHGLKAKMKNKLMPMWDKIMLRKRYIMEGINELLKNKADLVHSRHRSIHNFIMNLCSA